MEEKIIPAKYFTHDIPILDETIKQWQDITDILASLLNVPAALIMRADEKEIEVFVSSESDGNPYEKGAKEHLWGSGLYCEWVITNQKKLLVADALNNSDWDKNPDIKLNMISYLGYPLSYPDGAYFGTICVLDNKRNAYSDDAMKILEKFQEVINGNLSLALLNNELGEENRSLNELCDRVRLLKGIHPICSYCKSIKNENDEWEHITEYITRRSEAIFSHTVCIDCLKEKHPEKAKRMGIA